MIPQFFYGSTIYYMANLRHGWEHYFTYMLVMVLENFVGIGLGMVLSASLKSVEMAPQIAPAVVIVFLMFSGFFLNDDSIPVYLSWLKYISFIRYAYQALSVNEFRGAIFEPSSPPKPYDMNGDQFLAAQNFENVTIFENCVYLGIMLAVFNIMALVILILRRPTFLTIQRGVERVE